MRVDGRRRARQRAALALIALLSYAGAIRPPRSGRRANPKEIRKDRAHRCAKAKDRSSRRALIGPWKSSGWDAGSANIPPPPTCFKRADSRNFQGAGRDERPRSTPSKIRRQRQSSFAEAKRQNAIKFEPIDFAHMLRVTKADRHRLSIWQIAAIDATPEECRAFSLNFQPQNRLSR